MRIFLVFFMAVVPAFSFEVQPTEIVEATPLDYFSERSALWPAQKTKQNVAKAAGESSFEVLDRIHGFQVSEQGSPLISIRGSGSLARTLSLYDGVPLNFGDGLGTNAVLIPIENLASVSYIKGPASLFYGADAMGGAVQFIPRLFHRPILGAGFGSFGSRNVFGSIPLLHSEENKLVGTVYHDTTSGDFSYSASPRYASGTRSANEKDLARATLTGRHRMSGINVSERFILGQEIASTPGSVTSPSRTNSQRRAGLGSVTLDRPVSENWGWSYRLSHTFSKSEFQSSFGPSTYEADRTQNSLSMTHVFSSKIEGDVFLDSTYDGVKAAIDFGGKRFFRSEELGTIFRIPTGGDAFLQPGIRYLSQYGQFVKALAYIEEKGRTKTWASYAEGFRPPAATQLYGDTNDYEGNPFLKPEESKQIELGFFVKGDPAGSFVGRSNYGLTAATTDYSELMQYRGSPKGKYVNDGKATAKSIELEWSQEVGVWTFEFQYTYLDTYSYQSNRPLRIAPKDQLSAAISHQIGPMVMELRNTYWGTYYSDSGGWIELGPWSVTDFNIRTLGFTDGAFKLGVKNIFDVAREITPLYPEPQRRFYLSAEYYL